MSDELEIERDRICNELDQLAKAMACGSYVDLAAAKEIVYGGSTKYAVATASRHQRGLVVLDLADEELVERVAHEFWLPLQDYMPGMDKDGWDNLIARIGPKIISALSAATPGSAA